MMLSGLNTTVLHAITSSSDKDDTWAFKDHALVHEKIDLWHDLPLRAQEQVIFILNTLIVLTYGKSFKDIPGFATQQSKEIIHIVF